MRPRHVHLLVHYPPKIALSKLVNSLKGVSARILRKEFSTHVRKHLWGDHFWSGSYFAGSVGGAPLTMVKQYIEQQNQPIRSECTPLRLTANRLFLPHYARRSASPLA